MSEKRKIITFDGAGGSGKSTQARKIAKVLNGKTIELDIIMNGLAAIQYLNTGRLSETSCFKALAHLAVYDMIVSYQPSWLRCNAMCIEDGFWASTLNLLRHEHKDKRHEFIKIIDAFLSYNDIHPTTSIFLDVPSHLGLTRRIEREQGYQIDNINIEKTDKDNDDWFEIQRQTFCWLAETFPYCHVVDGSQSENEVSDDIMGIIQNDL